MPSLFGKGVPKPTQYRQLEQDELFDSDLDMSENEDEKIIFRKPGDLELNLYPDNNAKLAKRRELQKERCRKMCGIAVVVTMATVVTVGLIVRYSTQQHEVTTMSMSPEWEHILDNFMMENGLVLMDVDGDDKDDLIFSAANGSIWNDLVDIETKKNKPGYQFSWGFCQDKGLEYPCQAVVFALRGYDGQELWRLKIRSGLFNMNCDEFDLDGDGRVDCIGTGRRGIVTAFNPYTGKQIWTVEDDSLLNAEWNTYQALPLPDFDQDGILEVLIANGGNPKFPAEVKNRTSGRLVILSGATGTPLGNSFLELPNNKETYMSPILYQQTNGSTPYILVGSGGETIPGDLMGISVADLCRAILGSSMSECPPSKDLPWPQMTKDDQGFFVIYRGERKGVMVPPVIVDVDQDGVMDIVASVYDGAVLLVDGKTMQQKWKIDFPDMESYSTPAPGHFDDDNIIDFMMHWNKGTWRDRYNETLVSVISGKTGEILWQTKSQGGIQTSDLVIRGNGSNHDYFLFRQTYVPDRKHNRQHKRHGSGGHTIEESDYDTPEGTEDIFSDCQNQYQHLPQQMLLVDRSTMQTPFKILDLPVKELYYEPKMCPEDDKESVNEKEDGLEVTVEDQDHHIENHKLIDNLTDSVQSIVQPVTSADSLDGEPSSTKHKIQPRSRKQFCAQLKPHSVSTGALGDVDGDGMLDYVNIAYFSASLSNTCFKSDIVKVQTAIHVVALEKHLRSAGFEAVKVNIESTVPLSDEDKQQHSVAFLPLKQQKWTKYMGTKGNNWYL